MDSGVCCCKINKTAITGVSILKYLLCCGDECINGVMCLADMS